MLSALSHLATAFGALAGSLRKRPGVTNVTVAVDIWQNSTYSNPTVEAYVDVELRCNRNVAWHINIRIEQTWIIDYYLGISHDEGELRIHTFEELTSDTLEGFVDALHEATSNLAATVPSFDLMALCEPETDFHHQKFVAMTINTI